MKDGAERRSEGEEETRRVGLGTSLRAGRMKKDRLSGLVVVVRRSV